MTAVERLFEGRCVCGHIDTRHDRTQAMPGRRVEALALDTYPCLDCNCPDWVFSAVLA